ncbi:hypothetical protein GCM10027174_36540 [Salinifilum aidingensis]
MGRGTRTPGERRGSAAEARTQLTSETLSDPGHTGTPTAIRAAISTTPPTSMDNAYERTNPVCSLRA